MRKYQEIYKSRFMGIFWNHLRFFQKKILLQGVRIFFLKKHPYSEYIELIINLLILLYH